MENDIREYEDIKKRNVWYVIWGVRPVHQNMLNHVKNFLMGRYSVSGTLRITAIYIWPFVFKCMVWVLLKENYMDFKEIGLIPLSHHSEWHWIWKWKLNKHIACVYIIVYSVLRSEICNFRLHTYLRFVMSWLVQMGPTNSKIM